MEVEVLSSKRARTAYATLPAHSQLYGKFIALKKSIFNTKLIVQIDMETRHQGCASPPSMATIFEIDSLWELSDITVFPPRFWARPQFNSSNELLHVYPF
jgi:hypothetical protein